LTIEKESDVLKKLKKGVNLLYMHDDADGIASAVLLSHAFPVKDVFCPEDFGEWEAKADLSKKYVPPDVCVDMIPKDPEWAGLCIDHHPNHPPSSVRKYTLVWDGGFPATGIVYNLFKEHIPAEDHWKMVVGLVGDGQADLIPPEIWAKCPSLLDGYGAVYEKYGKITIYKLPVYLKLSSFINAPCKIPDKWYTGYQVLKNAKEPLDIIEDPALKAAKETVDEEYRRVMRDSAPIEFPNLRVWRISSDYKLERTFAWKASEIDQKTCLILNTKTGRMSLRGVLSLVIYEELKKMNYNINGHAGFGGGKLTKNQTPEQLVRDLRKIKII